ncbi:hypothetical protein SAMN05428997_10560 [Bosea sp. CRIB-10]|uniref:hypothetical protein n=1 Tax=Bosea sp. CRIB-10 TaxID=378404 RepID=UPI0008ED496E|nr:hypothetical protein [Bosea sp. CRIB-10]SFC23660.1 hypothetical protein SAMN05428997_10560 [Bosea sp. CRIB-10]
MDITVYEGTPGSRKTLTLLDTIVAAPGRHVIAFPRTELIDEQADYCRQKARELGTRPSIVMHHSKRPRSRGDVGRQIEDTLRAKADQSHVLLMITHASLLELDPALLVGWHVVFDENPDSSVASGTFAASASWSMLQLHFQLEPVAGSRVWQVLASDDAPMLNRRQIAAEGEGDLQRFLTSARNSRRAVFVDIGDWEDAKSGRKVGWWSIWTPLVLDNCASVTFTAAAFFESLPYRATQWLAGDQLVPNRIDLGAGASRARARVRVHYYVRHAGSTEWWKTDEGSRCLVRISEHQARLGGVGYWSCNPEIWTFFCHRFEGVHCKPKQAGTNSLIEHRSCLLIYSSKAQSGDGPIMELLGLDRNDVRRAREFEDVRQFALRGALRRRDFAGDYDVYLYDQSQAEDLAGYLREIGIADVEVVPVEDAGTLEMVRPEAVPFEKRVSLTAKEKRDRNTENQRRRRAQIKAQEEEKGIMRRRGRPKV